MQLDKTDKRILNELQRDSSISNVELAQRVHLSASPCLARVKAMECYLMTGAADYLIRVAVADISALKRFILDQLTPIPGIEKIRSSFALKQVSYKTGLPMDKIAN